MSFPVGSFSALAGVAVRPGVQHVGRAQASPPTAADCQKAYKVACYSPAQIYASGVRGFTAVRGCDLVSGAGTVNAAFFVRELAAAPGH